MNLVEKGRQFVSGMFTSSAINHGLMNQGATCYLNSVLQVLFMTEEFREAVTGFVARYTFENPDTDRIDCHLKNLFDDLIKRTAYTYNITRTLGIDRVSEQRDAAQYFEKILSLTSPEASKIFHGELTHTKECCVCHLQTNTGGQFWHLPLALVDSCSENYSVVDGIKNFFSTSNVNGQNQMYCDKCDDKADATLRSVMTHHPDVLTLLLKRFEFDYRYMAYVKIECTVDVPCTLQIPENQTYELYAVVDHFGDLRGGHYTATIKSHDDRWYNFDDTNVSVHHYQPFQMDNQVEKSQSAYLLFYKKKKMEDADTCTQDTSETSTHESLPLDISDNNQHQDADNIREKHEGEGEAEMSNDTAEFCEKESRDMDSFESRGVEIISDAEDSGRKTGAELREVDSERTNLDENLEVQSNGRGGIDGVTQRIPCEVLVGDEQFEKGTKTSSNYLTKDDREYEGNNCQNICKDQEVEKKHYGKQEGEENMEVNLEGDEEGKTKDDELTSGSNKEVKGQDNERSDHDSQVIHDGQERKLDKTGQHYGLECVSVEKQGDEEIIKLKLKKDKRNQEMNQRESIGSRRLTENQRGQMRQFDQHNTQPDVRSGSHSVKRRMKEGSDHSKEEKAKRSDSNGQSSSKTRDEEVNTEMSKKGSKKSWNDEVNSERKSNLKTDSLAKGVNNLTLSHTESPEPKEHKIVQYSNSAGLSNAEEMQNEPTTGLLFAHGKTSKEKGRRRWWHLKHPLKSDKKQKTPGCFCMLKSRKNEDQMSD